MNRGGMQSWQGRQRQLLVLRWHRMARACGYVALDGDGANCCIQLFLQSTDLFGTLPRASQYCFWRPSILETSKSGANKLTSSAWHSWHHRMHWTSWPADLRSRQLNQLRSSSTEPPACCVHVIAAMSAGIHIDCSGEQ
jgi:hypothetical protein